MSIKILKDELVYDGQYVQLIRRHFVDMQGRPGVWEMVRRKTFGRIVKVAAVTSDNQLVFIKIYRIPVKDYILELPAGIMDKPGESETEMAKRELLEETGYVGDEPEFLIAGPFNAGLVEDEIAIYLIRNAKAVKAPQHEAAEDIQVMTVPVPNVLVFLQKSKMKVDVKTACVLPFLAEKLSAFHKTE